VGLFEIDQARAVRQAQERAIDQDAVDLAEREQAAAEVATARQVRYLQRRDDAYKQAAVAVAEPCWVAANHARAAAQDALEELIENGRASLAELFEAYCDLSDATQIAAKLSAALQAARSIPASKPSEAVIISFTEVQHRFAAKRAEKVAWATSADVYALFQTAGCAAQDKVRDEE
jgi:hypothetical protein